MILAEALRPWPAREFWVRLACERNNIEALKVQLEGQGVESATWDTTAVGTLSFVGITQRRHGKVE